VYHIKENNQITPLDHEESYKDLGVTFDEKLTFRDLLHDKVHKACNAWNNQRKLQIH